MAGMNALRGSEGVGHQRIWGNEGTLRNPDTSQLSRSLVGILCVAVQCLAETVPLTSVVGGAIVAEENKMLARRWLDEFWGAGNFAGADEIFASTYLRHDFDGPMIGTDAIRGYVAAIRVDIPDLHFTADDVVAEGDRVVVRWTATGTHARTSRPITFAGMDILRIRDGKIVESWPCFDRLGIERQLGAS